MVGGLLVLLAKTLTGLTPEKPINVVVYHEIKIPNLGVGFALRCFQRLSLPYIATRQFTW